MPGYVAKLKSRPMHPMSSPMNSATFRSLLLASALGIIITLAPRCTGLHVLHPGQTLDAGQSLTWELYVLAMQHDCNLVLYDNSQPVWSTQTYDKGTNCRFFLQDDGNAVVMDENTRVVWQSGKRRQRGTYVFILQRDRNLVVYGPSLWSSGTNVPAFAAADSVAGGAAVDADTAAAAAADSVAGGAAIVK